MNTQMMIVLGLEFIEAIICIIYAVFTYAILQSSPEGKSLWHILLDNAIMVAAEAICTLYIGTNVEYASLYVNFSLYIILLTQFVILYLLGHYISLRTKDMYGDTLSIIIISILTGLALFNPWTHFYFHVNENNSPVPGPLVFISMIVATSYFILNLVKLMVHYRRFQNFWWIILMTAVTLPFIALMYELSSWDFKWIHICNTISFVTIVTGYMIVKRKIFIRNMKFRYLLSRERKNHETLTK